MTPDLNQAAPTQIRDPVNPVSRQGLNQPRPCWRIHTSGCREVVLRVVLRTAAHAHTHTQQREARSTLQTTPFPSGAPYLLLKMVTFSWLLERVDFNRAGEGTHPWEISQVWSWGQRSREK